MLTRNRALAITIGIGTIAYVLIWCDAIDINWAVIVGILIAIFGFILQIMVKLSRLEQKLDDHLKYGERSEHSARIRSRR